MRILIVAMAESIHTIKWMKQITDQGWEIHLFPSYEVTNSHPELKKIKHQGLNSFWPFVIKLGSGLLKHISPHQRQNYRAKYLAYRIKKIKPDIIHSMEFQSAGYLTFQAKKFLGVSYQFPRWIATNWGSDIYLYGQLPEHRTKIQEILKSCDYYSCECRRDIALARKYGLKAPALPVFPNSGGIDLKKIRRLRKSGRVSERKVIALKGYQGVFGRALTGLSALEKCQKILRDYEVHIYSATPDVVVAAELFSVKTGVPTKIIPLYSSHEEILKTHGRAQLSIGLSISDGISTSALEAMAMGSFPIQSNTSCADEWFENDKTGILVPPDEPAKVAQAIKKVLNNERMLNLAAKENQKMIEQKLDEKKIKKEIIKFYQVALEGK